MDDFKTVFLFTDNASFLNIGQKNGQYLGLYLALFSFLAILFVVFKAFLFPEKTTDQGQSNLIVVRKSTLLIFCGLIIIGLVWSALSIKPYRDYDNSYLSLVDIYNTQHYEIAEGVVHVLHIQAFSGHDPADVIRIDNVQFEVNFYSSSFGYTTSISHAGALTKGTYARVFYTPVEYSDGTSENVILRVDIKR